MLPGCKSIHGRGGEWHVGTRSRCIHVIHACIAAPREGEEVRRRERASCWKTAGSDDANDGIYKYIPHHGEKHTFTCMPSTELPSAILCMVLCGFGAREFADGADRDSFSHRADLDVRLVGLENLGKHGHRTCTVTFRRARFSDLPDGRERRVSSLRRTSSPIDEDVRVGRILPLGPRFAAGVHHVSRRFPWSSRFRSTSGLFSSFPFAAPVVEVPSRDHVPQQPCHVPVLPSSFVFLLLRPCRLVSFHQSEPRDDQSQHGTDSHDHEPQGTHHVCSATARGRECARGAPKATSNPLPASPSLPSSSSVHAAAIPSGTGKAEARDTGAEGGRWTGVGSARPWDPKECAKARVFRWRNGCRSCGTETGGP